MTTEAILLTILAAVGGAAVGIFALLPRMIESRIALNQKRETSQINNTEHEQSVRGQERLSTVKTLETMMSYVVSFGESSERMATAVEAIVTQSKQSTAEIIEQSKIASLRIAEQSQANTLALSTNTASMTAMDTNVQTSLAKLIKDGSVPSQRIEEIVLAIKAMLEIFEPIILSIPENMVVMKGLRDVYAASQRLVTQAGLTPIATQDKAEANALVQGIVDNVSNPPVSDVVPIPTT